MNTFPNTVEETPLKPYRISYKDGTFLTYWSGFNAAHALALAAEYYHISPRQLQAQIEL